MECDNGNMMEQRRARIFVLFNLRVDQAYTVYILPTYPFHRKTIIHQPNSIDVVITTQCALGRWSHNSHAENSTADKPHITLCNIPNCQYVDTSRSLA